MVKKTHQQSTNNWKMLSDVYKLYYVGGFCFV